MSVRIRTPPPFYTPDRLRNLLARILVSSCQPIDTAVKLRQVADDRLGGIEQLGRELAVGDDNNAKRSVFISSPGVVAARAG